MGDAHLNRLEADTLRPYDGMPECADMPSHARYSSGHLAATPGCEGRYCVTVFAEWSDQAIGFQRVLESGHLDVFLGTNFGGGRRG